MPIRIASKSVRCRAAHRRGPSARPGFAGRHGYCRARGPLAGRARATTTSSSAYPSVDRAGAGRARLGPRAGRRGHRHGRLASSTWSSSPALRPAARAAGGHRRRRLAARRPASTSASAARRCAPPARRRGRRPSGRRGRRRCRSVGPDVLRRPDRRAARLLAGRAAGQASAPTPSSASAAPRSSRAVREVARPASSSTAAAPAACTSPRQDPARDRARRRVRAVRPDPVRRLRRLHAATGGVPSSLPVVRRPGAGVRHGFRRRLRRVRAARVVAACPTPVWPAGLDAGQSRGGRRGADAAAGRGRPSASQLGDRVWFRHAKAGELCERFDASTCRAATELVETVPTYRGEGKNFG